MTYSEIKSKLISGVLNNKIVYMMVNTNKKQILKSITLKNIDELTKENYEQLTKVSNNINIFIGDTFADCFKTLSF